MWYPKTGGVHNTQYVIWLWRMFYAAPVAVLEIALEPDDDIIIVTPGHKEKADNPNEHRGERYEHQSGTGTEKLVQCSPTSSAWISKMLMYKRRLPVQQSNQDNGS
jgi:hypothetical protein